MTIRTRSQTVPAGTGSYYRNFFNVISQGSVPIPGFKGTCTDVVDGTYRDHPLTIDKTTYSNHTFTGTQNTPANSVYGKYVDDVPAYVSGTSFGHLALPAINDASDRTKALARMNPSRAVVDVPGFIAELRELPSLLKSCGKTLLKGGANAFLSYQYGWKPLISDLHNLMDFQRHVMKREIELRNLYGKGGLRRTFQLSTDMATQISHNVTIQSALYILTSRDYTIETSRRRWATSRWEPVVSKIPKTDHELHNLAVRAVYGLSAELSTAWNLIPWSWLIDWFSSTGDFFDAARNVVGATCSSCCTMQHTKSIHRLQGTQIGTGGFTVAKMPNPVIIVEQKSRAFGTSPSITADLPFLSGTQMSILGALGIQRLRGIH